ncbi:cold-shock protein [Coprobacter tertius]|uniref:Cold shock domain-containing protein n=1 Tax=Coprobacter tertius TaxID=2944915 RepID=A0ABT1MHZ8_9BACT|nr:cold shock domain-containing protein [Coprobacter tertius]MCP9612259.1 cold shock domain-containing protein [Coprobacter tertius]
MAVSFNKRELQKKKQSKRLEKQKRKEERKATAGSGSLEDMIAYVDENGVITDTPPEIQNSREINVEDIAISTPKKGEVEEVIQKGKIDFFNPEKGYGFIRDSHTNEKYFFHISNAPDSITEGNKVSFELEAGPKGINAVRIVLID